MSREPHQNIKVPLCFFERIPVEFIWVGSDVVMEGMPRQSAGLDFIIGITV